MKPKGRQIQAKSALNGVQNKAKANKTQNIAKKGAKTVKAQNSPVKRVNKLLEKLQADSDDEQNDLEVSDNDAGAEVSSSDDEAVKDEVAALLDSEAVEGEETDEDEDEDVEGEQEDADDADDDDDEQAEDASDAEEADDASDDDEQPAANGNGAAAASDSDDEAPAEVPIEKKHKAAVGNIKTGAISEDIPNEQVIFVSKVPLGFDQNDIVEVFGKYGAIQTIQTVQKLKNALVFIAYDSAKAAEAALAANQKAKINGQVVNVSLRRVAPKDKQQKEQQDSLQSMPKEDKKRTIIVRRFAANTSEQQLRELFGACGEIENVQMHKTLPLARITFTDKSFVAKAKKLHHKVFNDANIFVTSANDDNALPKRDPTRTIIVNNVEKLKSVEPSVIEGIFAKCGEIEEYTLLCSTKVLAIITFKEESAVKKAQKLNGDTVNDLKLEFSEYSVIDRQHISVVIKNLQFGTTEEQVRAHFANAGEIAHIYIQKNFAIVRFKDSDGYCKAFMQHETTLNNRMIFLEPFSQSKNHASFHNKHGAQNRKAPQLNRKRPANTFAGNNNAGPQKFKKFKKSA